jgi:hypothetical protein
MTWIIRSTLFVVAVALAPSAHADRCKDVPQGQLSHDDYKYCETTYNARAEEEAIKNGPTRQEVEAIEARKRSVRISSGYRDPISINMCPPPPYVMTDRDGCYPRGARKSIVIGRVAEIGR